MAAKHEKESDEVAPDARKPKHGFRVGPENLPDGPWRRKGWPKKFSSSMKSQLCQHTYIVTSSHQNQEGADSQGQSQEGLCKDQGSRPADH